jgi:hypothetical protein
MALSGSSDGVATYVTLRTPLTSQAAEGSPLHSESPFNIPQWYLSHSTRAQWKSSRNVQLRLDPASKSEIEWSWQSLGSNKVKRSKISENDANQGWDVLGAGKEGNLESWMIKTSYGIEDSSG